jgi:TrmH family RNA methyltransferase
LPRARVVLVRPELPANVGAVARVIRNTGLAGLDLVSPGDWRTLECWRSAWEAQDVLEQARVTDSLAAALEDASLSVAFSGRSDRGVAPRDVRELAEELGALGEAERVALVFGPESSGLTGSEIACCGRRARIPAHPAQPSFNLSHAVMVAGYELLRATRPGATPGPRRASHAEKEALLALLREGLLAVKALPEVNTDGYFQEWRAFFQRADMSVRELRLLEHLARRLKGARG